MTKRSLNIKTLVTIISGVLGLAAIILFLFLPVATLGDVKLTGLNAMLGYTSKHFIVDMEVAAFSIMILVTLIIDVVALLLTLSSFIRTNKIVPIVATVLFLVSGVLMFFAPEFIVLGRHISRMELYIGTIDFKLAYGAIISAVSLLAAGGATCFSVIKK